MNSLLGLIFFKQGNSQVTAHNEFLISSYMFTDIFTQKLLLVPIYYFKQRETFKSTTKIYNRKLMRNSATYFKTWMFKPYYFTIKLIIHSEWIVLENIV